MKVKVKYELSWQAEFEISDVSKAAQVCKASLDFYGDPITREDDSEKELIRAGILFWLPTIIANSMRFPNAARVIESMEREEGCMPLDGSQGIKLVQCERWEFDRFYFDVEIEEAA